MILYKNREIEKNKLRRNDFESCEPYRFILKSLLSSSVYSRKSKIYYSSLFHAFTKFNSITRCSSICILSASTNVIFRKFKLCRHFFKHYASEGIFSGLRKSSF